MRKNAKSWNREAVMDYVCHTLIGSSKGLGGILKSAPFDMPNRTTVLAWISENKHFQDTYARAREMQVYFLLEEIIEIADNVGTQVIVDGKVVTAVDNAALLQAKLMIDTRKWLISKLAPKNKLP